MPMMPAFCTNCGAAFSSGIFIENCRNVAMHGNMSGPCPRCGGMGAVPNGVFNVIDGVIDIINGNRSSTALLNHVTNLLNKAITEHKSADEISENIRAETPELSSIADVLPKTRNELYAFIALLLALITFVLNSQPSDTSSKEEIIEMLIEKTMQPQYYIPYEQPTKPSRNSPCPCGSGERYKRCCGKVI